MKKFNALFLAATLLAAPVAAAVAPVSELTVEAASAKSFSDVSKNNAYYDIINAMTAQGIIKGYEDGTFKPEQALSRKHAAELVYRLDKLKKPAKSKATPKDLTKKHPNYEAIMMLYNHGLLVLDSKGNINPNAELSRGEMAKILATTFALKGSKHPLKDVSSSISSYVAALYENGVTTGFEDKTFKEKQSLTRAHYAVFMYRAMNPVSSENLTVNSSVEEFNRYIQQSPYFADGLSTKGTNEVFRQNMLDIEGIVAGTDLKVVSLSGGGIGLQEDGWKALEPTYLFKQVSTTNKGQMSFDYMSDSALLVTKRLIENEYDGKLDIEKVYELLDKQVAIAKENFADKKFDNFDNFEVGKYKVRIGVSQVDKSKTFTIQFQEK